MQRIAITGANGFTGRYLVELLLERGYDVHALTHGNASNHALGVQCYDCDLLESESISNALSAIQPHKIIHLAAISFVPHGDVEAIYRTNIVGTRNLLQASADGAFPISSILLTSSANIYGNQTGGILTESNKAAPANDYAVSKIAMEYVGKIYSSHLPIIIVRPFNYTGVGQSLNFLIPKIVDHLRRRAPNIELGNLDVIRDFSDVRSVAATYAALLEEQSAVGKIYNICSGRGYSLQKIIEIAQNISGHLMEIRVNPAYVRGNEVKTLIGSRARVDALFPELPNPSLEETLEWMLYA